MTVVIEQGSARSENSALQRSATEKYPISSVRAREEIPGAGSQQDNNLVIPKDYALDGASRRTWAVAFR
jgi:hypothetical protein